MKYAAFNINFDSLNEMYGFPDGYRDKTFFEISERFFKLSDRYGFKYSIFVIGKDLEKPENRERVREWARRGHEIGNHSWSHPLNLSSLSPSETRREIELAHHAITKAAGREPRGFIAPGWSTSDDVVKTLIDLGYVYDTSVFPSWLMYLSLMRMLMINFGNERFGRILRRRDLLAPILAPRGPYYTTGGLYEKSHPSRGKGLLMLPTPSNRLRIISWHTFGFIFGWRAHEALLDSCLRNSDAFYYLMHPADLIEMKDLDRPGPVLMERMSVSLDKKEELLERYVRRVVASGRKIVTMEELAARFMPSEARPATSKAEPSPANEPETR